MRYLRLMALLATLAKLALLDTGPGAGGEGAPPAGPPAGGEGEGGEGKPPAGPDPAAEVEKWKALARKHETRAKENATAAEELAKLREGQKTELDKQLDAARKEAASKATSEITTRYNARIIRAEVLAAAGGKLADPADAAAMLDLSQFNLNDDLEVDRAAIGKAIDELVKTKPYLAPGSGKRFAGAGDGGPRGGGDRPEPKTPHERLMAAFAPDLPNSST